MSAAAENLSPNTVGSRAARAAPMGSGKWAILGPPLNPKKSVSRTFCPPDRVYLANALNFLTTLLGSVLRGVQVMPVAPVISFAAATDVEMFALTQW